MSKIPVIEDFGFDEDNLETLERICNLFSRTEPEPESKMGQQIMVTRALLARFRGSVRLRSGPVTVTNVEIVKVDSLTRVAYVMVTDPKGQQYLADFARDGVTPQNVTRLWIQVSQIMKVYKQYGPYGYEGLN